MVEFNYKNYKANNNNLQQIKANKGERYVCR